MSFSCVSRFFDTARMGLAYVNAVAIANVRTVHGVRHQDVDKSVVQRPAIRLKDLEIGKCAFDVSMNSIEPCFFLTWFAVRLTVRNFLFDISRPLQCFEVCAFGEG